MVTAFQCPLSCHQEKILGVLTLNYLRYLDLIKWRLPVTTTEYIFCLWTSVAYYNWRWDLSQKTFNLKKFWGWCSSIVMANRTEHLKGKPVLLSQQLKLRLDFFPARRRSLTNAPCPASSTGVANGLMVNDRIYHLPPCVTRLSCHAL